MNEEKLKIKDALIKKAIGFFAEDVTEEYNGDGEEIKLIKKKVTKKYVPPDISAIKLLIGDVEKSVESMTDEELEEERQRLCEALKIEGTEN